jgi:hypothetical protein
VITKLKFTFQSYNGYYLKITGTFEILGAEKEEMNSLLLDRFKADWLTVYLSILASLIFTLCVCAFLRRPIFEAEITTFNHEIKCI